MKSAINHLHLKNGGISHIERFQLSFIFTFESKVILTDIIGIYTSDALSVQNMKHIHQNMEL